MSFRNHSILVSTTVMSTQSSFILWAYIWQVAHPTEPGAFGTSKRKRSCSFKRVTQAQYFQWRSKKMEVYSVRVIYMVLDLFGICVVAKTSFNSQPTYDKLSQLASYPMVSRWPQAATITQLRSGICAKKESYTPFWLTISWSQISNLRSRDD